MRKSLLNPSKRYHQSILLSPQQNNVRVLPKIISNGPTEKPLSHPL